MSDTSRGREKDQVFESTCVGGFSNKTQRAQVFPCQDGQGANCRMPPTPPGPNISLI